MSERRDELVAGIYANREKFESAGDRAEELALRSPTTRWRSCGRSACSG